MRKALAIVFALLATSPATSQIAPPERHAQAGTVEVATSAELAPILEKLAAVFAAQNPGLSVQIKPMGSNVAMATLYTGQVDLGIIGRRIADQEAKGFEWIYLKPPVGVEVFRGSANLPGRSPSLAVVVSEKSSVQSLTMAELAARFQPGMTGRIYMPDSESGTGRFFRETVLAGANQLDWARVVEIEEIDHRRPEQVSIDIAKRVAQDRDAIGISDATPRPGVRVVPVSDAGDRFERKIYAYAHPAKRKEAESFLAFLRSAAAQAIIATGPFRPLKNQ